MFLSLRHRPVVAASSTNYAASTHLGGIFYTFRHHPHYHRPATAASSIRDGIPENEPSSPCRGGIALSWRHQHQ
jgi:hypothetical protein